MYSRISITKHYTFAQSIIFTCLLSLVCPQIGASPEKFETNSQIDGVWRNAEHGGINALYPLLRSNGYADGYRHYQSLAYKCGLPNSFADLRHFASTLGFQLDVFYLSPQRLADVELPCILHLEDDPADGGAFVVLLQVRKNEVVYLHGPSAIVVQDSRERFFRRLSEAAAIVTPARSGYFTSILLGSGLGVIVIAILNKRTSRDSKR